MVLPVAMMAVGQSSGPDYIFIQRTVTEMLSVVVFVGPFHTVRLVRNYRNRSKVIEHVGDRAHDSKFSKTKLNFCSASSFAAGTVRSGFTGIL